jgi:uncharacterized membrane protein
VNRAAAAACYIPVPGLSALVARGAPHDRLVRFHAWQGGTLTVLVLLVALGLGFVLQSPDLAQAATSAAAVVVGVGLLGLLTGVVAAASGRFWRIRPVWDLAAALQPRAPVRPVPRESPARPARGRTRP